MPLDRRSLLLVAAGAVVGAALRWWLDVAIGTAGTFPWPTFWANVAGCLVLGLLWGAPARPALIVGTGLCGGLTTFSTLMVEVAELGRDGQATDAAAYLTASVLAGLVALSGARWIRRTALAASGAG